MRAQEYGKIVNVSSVHGLRTVFGISNYAASKAGLIGLTQSAAVELGPMNINVNAVAPGYIRTTRLTQGFRPTCSTGHVRSLRWGGSATRRTSRAWCCSFAPRQRGTSREP